MKKVLLFANTEWYLFNFRLGFAKFLRERGFEVVMVSPQGPYGSRLEAEGFRWIPLDMDRRSLNPWRELKLIVRISVLLREEAPVLLHNFTIKCVVYGSLASRLVGVGARLNAVAGMGYIFSGRGLQVRLLKPIVKSLLKLALSGKSARLVVQNQDDLFSFVHAGLVPKNSIRLIKGSGVNTNRFRPPERCREVRPTRVLLAARLLWDKGVGEYVEAARKLKEEGLDIEFWLAGDIDLGNPASVSASDVESWRKAGVVLPLGHVEDMAKLLAEIDIMVLPSSYREGVPRSLIEAASCGLPIITTEAPGCREIVEDGVNGYLVPVRDANGLANAIRRLHADPALRHAMGKTGREVVLKEFDEQIVFDKTLAVYHELLSEMAK
ncbi:MAG: glycosyltransferase family 4 protein [Bacteroidota bacterium]